jgi:hypothetical protein
MTDVQKIVAETIAEFGLEITFEAYSRAEYPSYRFVFEGFPVEYEFRSPKDIKGIIRSHAKFVKEILVEKIDAAIFTKPDFTDPVWIKIDRPAPDEYEYTGKMYRKFSYKIDEVRYDEVGYRWKQTS